MEEKISNYLKKYSTNFKLHSHEPVFTVAESSKIKNKIPGIKTKALFLKGGDKRFYLVCLVGEKRLNISGLKRKLNLKKLQFASPSELKEHLNLTPGSVSPFGLINSPETTLLIDEDIWSASLVTFHPNINTETLELEQKEFRKFLDTLQNKIILLPL